MFSAGALCCRTKTMCSKEVFDMTINLPIEIAKAVMDYKDPVKEIKDIKKAIEDILDMVLPLCSQMEHEGNVLT